MFNAYYCFIDETKLTEIEWNKVHADEVANHTYDDMFGYWHCNSYIAYSASFDRCMADQIKRRENLRNWYRELREMPFNAKWDESYSDFSDCFKDCFGRRPHLRGELLKAKGLPEDTPWAC